MWSYVIVVMLIPAALGQLVTAPMQYKGEKGAKGDIGATGSQGAPGVIGGKGSSGDAGLLGQKGAKGPAGLDGTDAVGPGEPGAPGLDGATGATGATGVGGLTGSTGSNGLPGSKGLPGSVGEKGNRGNKGLAGDIGATGSRGPQGNTGMKGAKGVSGPPGLKGYVGPQGAKGYAGYPFQDGASQYTDGCVVLDGHPAKQCDGVCHDRVTYGATAKVEGVCMCQNGYSRIGDSCIKDFYTPNSGKACGINNGGCSHICSNGQCSCPAGYRLRKQGQCTDINECLDDSACGETRDCLNTLGSYKCVESSSAGQTAALKIQGSSLVNENVLLAILVWFGLLLIVILIILIAISCLPPVRLSQPKVSAHSTEFLMPMK